MALLSVKMAASRLGVDERTLRRWIKAGTLTASAGVSGRARIDEQEVARLQARLAEEETAKKQAQPDIAKLLMQIEMMESKIDDLESKVDDLSGKIEDLESEIRAGPRGKQVAARSPRATDVTSSSKRPLPGMGEMPDGLEIATVFAQRHYPTWSREQITRLVQTLRETSIEEKRVPMIEGEYKAGRARAHWALDAEGRARFYQVNYDHAGFELCDDCPH